MKQQKQFIQSLYIGITIAISQTITVYAEEINNSNSVNSVRPNKISTNNESKTSDENNLLPTSNNITTNIIQPAQQSILETIDLNPSNNPSYSECCDVISIGVERILVPTAIGSGWLFLQFPLPSTIIVDILVAATANRRGIFKYP